LTLFRSAASTDMLLCFIFLFFAFFCSFFAHFMFFAVVSKSNSKSSKSFSKLRAGDATGETTTTT
jgi:hypothetical protein